MPTFLGCDAPVATGSCFFKWSATTIAGGAVKRNLLSDIFRDLFKRGMVKMRPVTCSSWIYRLCTVSIVSIFTFAMPIHAAEAEYDIRIPTVVSYELNLPSLVAYAKGYFKEEGINVSDFVLGSGGTQRAGVIAGEYDLGLFGFVHVPIARLAGSPWKAVLTLHQREIFSLIVRSGLKDRVKEVADLKGLVVGFSSPGASAWYVGSLYLKNAGLNPETDVKYVPLGGNPSVIYTALKSGRVDAFVSWEPTTTRAIHDGIAYPLVSIWQPEDHAKWIGATEAASMLAITREDVIKAQPELVRHFVEANKKALRFIQRATPAEIADTVLDDSKVSPQFAGLSRDLVIEMVEKIKSGFGDGCLSRAGFKVEMDLASQFGIVKAPITFEDFADARFAGVCP